MAVRLREHDESALEAFYDRYAGLSLALAYRVVGDMQVAEDIVQESFLSLWRNASSFDPARGSLRSWIITIVKRRAIDKVRSAAIRPKIARDVDIGERRAGDDVEATVFSSLTAVRVRAALANLPQEQRETLELSYFGDLSQSEVAEQMGVPLGTVKGRVRMAIAKLREALGNLDEGQVA